MTHAQFLKSCALFSGLDRRTLNALAGKARLVELRGGDHLYQIGDVPDTVYVVWHGRLRLQDESGKIAREVGPGDPIGVISLISGESRSTNATAVRDSTVLAVSKGDFLKVLEKNTAATLELARLVVENVRMSRAERVRRDLGTGRTVALVPADESVDIDGFARELAIALGDIIPSYRLDAARVNSALGENACEAEFDSPGNAALVSYLNDLEDRYRYVVYQASADDSHWTRRCLRQSDRILLVVSADSQARSSAVIDRIRETAGRAPIEVIFLHRAGQADRVWPMSWREVSGATAHQHIEAHNSADFARLGRMVTGRAVGLVLGGGGARGVSHLGLIRALNERDVPIDVVGGCSIGAFIAGLLAYGMSYTETVAIMRRLFVENNNLNDYTVPRVSLISARKMRSRMEEIFGDTLIEDLRINYFATSTNLTRGELVIHDRGLLAHWIGTSMSVPGIAPPVVYKGDLLVDGGVINSLPTDVMQALGRGPIVASDVTAEDSLRADGIEGPDTEQIMAQRGKGRSPNIFKILFRTATLNAVEAREQRAESADLYIRMPIAGIGMFDWDAFDGVLSQSYDHASRALDLYLKKNALGR